MKQYRHWIGALGGIILGMIFIMAGAAKLMSPTSGYQPFAFPLFIPRAMTDVAYTGLPYVEIILGILLLGGIAAKLSASISATLIGCFIISNLYMLSIGMTKCAGCFGTSGNVPIYTSLILDVVMLVLSALIISCYTGGFFSKNPWFVMGHTADGCARAQCAKKREQYANL